MLLLGPPGEKYSYKMSAESAIPTEVAGEGFQLCLYVKSDCQQENEF